MPKSLSSKKFRNKNLSKVILLGYFIFVVVLGISYAYFSTILKINGVASLGSVEWPDGVLPTEPVKPESGTGTQISSSFQSEYLSGSEISSTAQNKFSTVTENYDTDTSTYTIQITKTATNGNSAKPIENFSLDFQIKNSSNVTWTSGEVTNTYTSNGNFLSNVAGTIDKTTLASNEVATLNRHLLFKYVEKIEELFIMNKLHIK